MLGVTQNVGKNVQRQKKENDLNEEIPLQFGFQCFGNTTFHLTERT